MFKCWEFKSPSGSNNGLYTCGLHINIRVFTLFSEHQLYIYYPWAPCRVVHRIFCKNICCLFAICSLHMFAKCSQQLFDVCLPHGRGNCMQRVRSKMFAAILICMPNANKSLQHVRSNVRNMLTNNVYHMVAAIACIMFAVKRSRQCSFACQMRTK